MQINDFVQSQLASQYSNRNAAGAVTRVPGASAGLVKAGERIQAQVDKTTAQLSSFGKLKLAVSDTQGAARALSGLGASASAPAVKTAANNLVNAFNATLASTKSTEALPGDVATTNATRVRQDLGRAVATDITTSDALKKIGIRRDSEGKLVLDANKLEAAQLADAQGVRSTLAKLGQRVDSTATQELATGGNVGLSLSQLAQRASVLKRQQSALGAL